MLIPPPDARARALPSVTLDTKPNQQEETFVPCYATLTSHMSTESFHEMKYKAPERRVPSAVAPPSSVARPNYHDALRRGEMN